MGKDKIIGYIERGVVIDRIPVGEVWRVVDLLGLKEGYLEGRVSLGYGYGSKKIGKKGILKVENMFLSPEQLSLVALVADKRTSISIISNGEVKRKFSAEIPHKLEGIILCPNSGCITNSKNQKVVPVINYNSDQELFTCNYCSRRFDKEEISFRDH